LLPFLPKWTGPIVFGLLLSGFVSFLAAGLASMILAGVNSDLPFHWLVTWLPSWALAFPFVLAAVPLLSWIVRTLVVDG